jgi:hypothetical protein
LHDLAYQRPLRLGVVLPVLPVLQGQLSLQGLIGLTIRAAVPQPVAKQKMAALVATSGRPHVHVNVALWRPQHAMGRLSHPKLVTGRLQWLDVEGLLIRVTNGDLNVDDRLRREARHCRRPDVVDAKSGFAERATDPDALFLEAGRP